MLGNLTESLKGTVGGVVLLIASFPILFNNEGCAVDIAKGLEEGSGQVVSIDPTKSISAFNGKLIHATGDTKASAKISDAEFGVEVAALVLDRNVEMYQWRENTKEDKDKKAEKTYTYEKEWSSSEINSNQFNDPKDHSNPPMPYEDKVIRPNDVSLGNLKFSDALIASISANDDLTYDQGSINRFKSKFGNKAKVHDGGIYIGNNPLSPEIGDIKIKHKVSMEGTTSIIGLLNGSTVNSYKTKRDTSILMFDFGSKDAVTMFQEAQDANVTRTWIVRVLGFLVMFFGFRLLFGPIAAAGGWIPILGGILEMGVSLVAGILAFSLSFVTIAIAWIFFRPLLGISLLVLGVGAFVYLYSQKGKFSQNPKPQT
ncbi:MAG: TMEM43 family protein [Leptospira sp.]|nr:TMEM43 family protein [Leptospira sp.]